MSLTLRLLLTFAFVIMMAHQSPAPISETPESPTPAPAVASTAKPKPKRLPKPKPKSEASEPVTNPAGQQPSPKQSRLAGTWVGTMPEIPWGNVATQLVVDETETTMEWQESEKRKGLAKAQLAGHTLRARFPGWAHATWSLTPQSDGETASVRLQAFMNDQTAVFHRTVVQSNIAKSVPSISQTTATPVAPQTAEIPTARPVPNKPGFVYNPFDPSSPVLLDVRGKSSGMKVKDPFSGKLFVVP